MSKSDRAYTFSDLLLGDMFNTKVARWVKTSDKSAICVLSSCVFVGDIHVFQPETQVVLLYSTVLRASND